MTEAMRDVCERATAAEAEPMLDGVSGRTAPPERPRDEGGHQDGPGEERGDPRLLRQQARQRLPREANSHTVCQEGGQGLSQRRVPRHRDLPRAGGCRSTPSLALRPSPCYPPETPKGLNYFVDTVLSPATWTRGLPASSSRDPSRHPRTLANLRAE